MNKYYNTAAGDVKRKPAGRLPWGSNDARVAAGEHSAHPTPGFPGQTARKSASRPKVANEDMLTPDQALQTVLARCRPLAARQVPLNQAVGRRLAETVQADRDYPPFDRAKMDGYAICPIQADPSREFQVVGQLAAGEVGLAEVRPGECVEIMTGAACPPGTGESVTFEWLAEADGTT